ncbi:MAG: sulfatase [Candidatus Hodarchaeota archaeon]
MKVILIFFDTLRKDFLEPYGCNWVHTPNFQRLAEKSVTFDNHYSGSLMCIPARRELHTGRYNFLHRSWGPLEPFDDSMPKLLKEKGIYTHLVSDHYHYWEVGGSTYHTQYNTWEIIRGHEGDPWKGEVKDPMIPDHVFNMREESAPHWRQDWVNRKYMQKEENMPQTRTFEKGLEFIITNQEEDNWFLQIETFDPHEPFYTQKKYKDLYKDNYDGPHFDWPNYSVVTEPPDQVEHCRKEYAASVSMCDYYLGTALDLMDEKDLWKDTMLIVTTDHGFLLGEKDWWGKSVTPVYNEIAQIPLFIWDPRIKKKNERRNALVQTIDLAPTILEFFGVRCPKDMQGKILKETIDSDTKIREVALFGMHGAHVNITDGQYLYMRGPINPINKPLYNYTLLPTHMREFFSIHELQTIELSEPFAFTKGCKTLKTSARHRYGTPYIYGSLLFDLKDDPKQENPIFDSNIEIMMIQLLRGEMKKNDAPLEQYERLGIPYDGEIKKKHLNLEDKRSEIEETIGDIQIVWKNKGKSMYYYILNYLPKPMHMQFNNQIKQAVNNKNIKEIDEDLLIELMSKFIPKNYKRLIETMFTLIKRKAK